MIGFFINITGLLSCLGAPFGALGSAAGSMAAARAQRRAYANMGRDFSDLHVSVPRDGLPPRDLVYLTAYDRWFRVVERPTNIPKVERRA